MTTNEAYNKIRYLIAEHQYYLDKINNNLNIITVLSIIAIIIALSAILFLSYSFFITKKQERELTKIKQELEHIKNKMPTSEKSEKEKSSPEEDV